MQYEVDITRFSQEALPEAKKFDSDKNGSLNSDEYNKFISVWGQANPSKSPYLMQLHINTLTDEAKKIAEECDTDDLKGVLTECELEEFMKKYEASGITYAFKNGVDVSEAITGVRTQELSQNEALENYKNNIFHKFEVKFALFKNWLKLDLMNYKGSDKFFHAVGNYEAMRVGRESEVEKVCAGQDADKRSDMQRSEADYAEDLYANWLGREFAKIYPTESPHELFAPLAPKGFNVEQSKKSVAKLVYDSDSDGILSQKYKEYKEFFKEEFILKRFYEELKSLFRKDEK